MFRNFSESILTTSGICSTDSASTDSSPLLSHSFYRLFLIRIPNNFATSKEGRKNEKRKKRKKVNIRNLKEKMKKQESKKSSLSLLFLRNTVKFLQGTSSAKANTLFTAQKSYRGILSSAIIVRLSFYHSDASNIEFQIFAGVTNASCNS